LSASSTALFTWAGYFARLLGGVVDLVEVSRRAARRRCRPASGFSKGSSSALSFQSDRLDRLLVEVVGLVEAYRQDRRGRCGRIGEIREPLGSAGKVLDITDLPMIGTPHIQ
jgi:hypothetical protein